MIPGRAWLVAIGLALCAPAFAAEPAAQVEYVAGPIHAEKIVFRGNRAIGFDELAQVATPYRGRVVQPDDVEELRRLVTRLYVDRGYVNSGARVAPETRDGLLVFEIVEGRLVGVRFTGLGNLSEGYVTDRLVPDIDAAFNMNALRERFQLLLADPLFARINGRVSPTGTPGESILDVDVVRALPYSLIAYANDYRPPSIGAGVVGLRGAIRNLTGYADAIEGSIEGPSGSQAISRWTFAAHMPLGARAPYVLLASDRGRSTVVEEPLASVDIRSTLLTQEIGLGYAYVETLTERWAVGASRVWRTNTTTLLGEPFSFIPGEPDGVTRAKGWRLWAEMTHRSDVQAATVRVSASSVTDNISDEGFLSNARPDTQYNVYVAQAQYLRRLEPRGLEFSARAVTQYVAGHALPLDELPLGGVYTVRGYRENQFIRQDAVVLAVQLDKVVWESGDNAWLSIGPFFDYGHGHGPGTPSVTLSSVGLASRLTWGRFTANLAIGRRLSHPELGAGSHAGLQGQGIHVEIAYSAF